ncbi:MULTISPECIES: phytanoyl-CoA dioxygenase family protein [Bizionia]|uniref:Phytanoyl-CoA dioxygenase family protein n=1 Tax=Bizionia algoritergicola TaxID=291187 RepID=A0A5D0QVE4_9FLAO|nr:MULTISPECIES: phytanoyl-CoA dioxygenase family protein [Bizionia]OBX22924.1 phytanoyl-CoA dioxygenase [Bizionia sp. APA-3]TYB72766.1 phytanoyl-CoA dioxygenase family protein [Bizionia algoritergicola]
MNTKTCHIYIDDKTYEFNVKGAFFWGKEELLYNKTNSVLSKMPWEHDGYKVVEAFINDEFSRLKESLTQNIIKAIKANNISFDENNFTLAKYHEVVNTDERHNQVINITRNLENEDFDFNIDALAERFGAILGYKLTSWVEELQKSHIQIRISRPNSLDINPPHRDGYLSYWEDIINVWIPIEGCNENSSLPVFPGSHLIPENNILRTESKGAEINGNIYYVPCILETKTGSIKMTRPNPKPGDALIFTPFLIHGAAVNNNKDITRVSLELRFPRI